MPDKFTRLQRVTSDGEAIADEPLDVLDDLGGTVVGHLPIAQLVFGYTDQSSGYEVVRSDNALPVGDAPVLAKLVEILTELGAKLEVGDQVEARVHLSDGTVPSASAPLAVGDDYSDGEVLAEVSGSNGVETITFTSAVNLLVAESAGEDLVSRLDPFGGTPTSSLGVPCRDEVPVYMPVTATTVKAYVPTGATLNVWGYRR